jgi:hypothetical protein
MKKEEIVKYLGMLGEELLRRGKTGEILLTGGAAMCLVHEARDMTKDVDALYEPKSDINEIVKRIAEKEHLPEDWMNDSGTGALAPSYHVCQECSGFAAFATYPDLRKQIVGRLHSRTTALQRVVVYRGTLRLTVLKSF